jgi:hypothetical protein
VLYLGASAAPKHVRQDHRCYHEVLCCRELRRGHSDSSPPAPPNIVLQLRLDSGFTADASHPCRLLLGFDGTTTATLRAAAVCSPGAGTFSGPYFQIMHTIIVCLWLYYILIVQGDRRSFRQPGLNSRTTPTTLSNFPLGGSRPPAFQFLAADIPSLSTRPMFQPAFDTTTKDEDWSVRGPVDSHSLV